MPRLSTHMPTLHRTSWLVLLLQLLTWDGAMESLKPHGTCKQPDLVTPVSTDMGQMVFNDKKIVKGLGCMTIKMLGKALGLAVGLRLG